MRPVDGAAIFLGVLLLLPGACSLYFIPLGVDSVPTLFYGSRYREDFGELTAVVWLSGLALGALGMFLIVRAMRRRV